jgi:hypothetical protein
MIVAVAAFFLFLYFLGEATDARRLAQPKRARRTPWQRHEDRSSSSWSNKTIE